VAVKRFTVDLVEWVDEAKREDAPARRVAATVERVRAGKTP
jgi:hypothetical protein